MFETINNPAVSPQERVTELRELLAGGHQLGDFVTESNNHIHTCYSFSPYTPAMAALRGREAGLQVVGSVDHDSIGAAWEMREAASTCGMGAVTGFEIRVMLHSKSEAAAGQAPFAERKLNNPDSAGVAYVTVQGIPEAGRERAEEFLRPIRERRLERTRAMAAAANEILVGLGAPTFDFERDVVGNSQYENGGTVTERHLLYAMSQALIAGFGRGQGLITGLVGMGLTLSDKVAAVLGEVDNPHLAYDLLGVLKAEYLGRFYLQPTYFEDGGELPDARSVVQLAKEVGAISCYAYLGDVSASPTGDKKAEKFEDDYLDELVPVLQELGFPAITFMPPRNTPAQLERVSQLAAASGLIEVSGVDINQPRQVFSCPELAEPHFAHLNVATWALVTHEMLSNHEPQFGLFHPQNPLAELPVAKRIEHYGELGPKLVGGLPPAAAAAQLSGVAS